MDAFLRSIFLGWLFHRATHPSFLNVGRALLAVLVLGTSPGCGPSSGRSTCADCHAPLDSHGEPAGIENAHPKGRPIDCAECHGGDPTAARQEDAHVLAPAGVSGPAHTRSLSSIELDALPAEWIQWINPSDYRVVDGTCGIAGCHEAISKSAPTSIMTTFGGHYNKPRFSAGLQDERAASVGVRTQEDPDWDGQPGTVPSLEVLDPPPLTEDSPIGDFLDHYLEKGCPRCHVWNFGPNDVAGDYRSSGCAGCHVVYRNDGLSRSADPTANLDDPPHPERHEITTAIPDFQCEHCHYRGNRIGTMYRGVREAGRLGDPANVEYAPTSLHGQAATFFVVDEDPTNTVDETPPDLHYQAGLGCVDCHTGIDVHGDGRLYTAHDYQVGIECEDCHGTVDAPITPDPEGIYRTTHGDPLRRIDEGPDGRPVLLSLIDGQTHPLSQLVDIQAEPDYPAAQTAHGRDANGFSHMDNLECYVCHTAWTQSCPGCHIVVDTRSQSRSLLDGEETDGRVGGFRTWVTMDYFALGVGVDGKITPFAPQEKMFITAIVPCDPAIEVCEDDPKGTSAGAGKRLYDQVVRRTADGKLGMGFGPVMPHTTSSTVQPCDRCHLRENESNTDILAETLGTGSGRFQIPDGDGVIYDLTQVVGPDGLPIVGMSHEGTAVLPPEIVQRMLGPRVPDSGLRLRQFPPWVSPWEPQ